MLVIQGVPLGWDILPENVSFRKSARGNKIKNDYIPVYLKNEDLTGENGSVFPELPYTSEHKWWKLNPFSQEE